MWARAKFKYIGNGLRIKTWRRGRPHALSCTPGSLALTWSYCTRGSPRGSPRCSPLVCAPTAPAGEFTELLTSAAQFPRLGQVMWSTLSNVDINYPRFTQVDGQLVGCSDETCFCLRDRSSASGQKLFPATRTTGREGTWGCIAAALVAAQPAQWRTVTKATRENVKVVCSFTFIEVRSFLPVELLSIYLFIHIFLEKNPGLFCACTSPGGVKPPSGETSWSCWDAPFSPSRVRRSSNRRLTPVVEITRNENTPTHD